MEIVDAGGPGQVVHREFRHPRTLGVAPAGSTTLPGVNILTTILWVLQFGLGLGLIFLVLIHSGRGGGLSDMFGGGLGASAAGSTVMEKNLDRITVVIALLFAFNTLILALVIDT
jgi:preprotein translocase subunit SecG